MNIAIRSGHQCAQPLLNALAVSSTSRVSLSLYNTKSEIDYFIDSVNKALSIL